MKEKRAIPINIRQLHYFLGAAEHGSFRRAAAALAVRESAVSRRIRDLEDELGASLFQRHSGGVRLTLAGRDFLGESRAVMKHLADGMRKVESIGKSESGRLSIGLLSSMTSGFLSNLFRTFSEDQDDVLVEFSEGNLNEHIAGIRLHTLDAIFLFGDNRYEGCESEQLWSEQMVAAVPENHRLASLSSLALTDLSGEVVLTSDKLQDLDIKSLIQSHILLSGARTIFRCHNVGRDTIMSLVGLGHGVTLTSEAMTSTSFVGVVFRPIANEKLSFSAVWSPRNDNPALRRLLSIARSMRQTEYKAPLPPLTVRGAEPSRIPDPSQ